MARRPQDSPGPSLIADARFLVGSGIARYVREVLSRLIEDDRFGRITLVGDAQRIHDFIGADRSFGPRLEVLPLCTEFYSPRAQLEWTRLRASGRLNADLAYFAHYDAPLVRGARRSVVVIHDLTHFKVPDLFPAWKRRIASFVFNRVVGRADRIAVTSNSTHRDLVERLPWVAEKIERIPLGVGEPFVSPAATPTAIENLKPYLLFVGNRKPHKNLSAVIEALALLRKSRPELRLVLAGHSYPGWEATRSRADELGVGEALVEMDDVGDEELRDLYAGSEALLIPSFYEGFGLPILEAMAAGAPVITSNRASLPEVAGDAALIIDPDRSDELAAAVRRLREDPELRRELISRGRRRAESLTWEATGTRTVDLLYRTAKSRTPDLRRGGSDPITPEWAGAPGGSRLAGGDADAG